jgi:asparagine synthase (glutamine-hydrolysing)
MHAFDPSWQPYVEPFPPGCAWTPERGLIRFAAAVPELVGPPPAESEFLSGTRDALVHAVERQLMGDVPVGVFLSGGLDSSLVAAIAAKVYAERGERLQTFAVGTPTRPTSRRAPRGRAHRLRAPRDDVHRREALGVRCRPSCASSSPSTPASCAARCRTSCSPRSPRST